MVQYLDLPGKNLNVLISWKGQPFYVSKYFLILQKLIELLDLLKLFKSYEFFSYYSQKYQIKQILQDCAYFDLLNFFFYGLGQAPIFKNFLASAFSCSGAG